MAILAPHVSAAYVVMFLCKTLEHMVNKSSALIEEKGSYEMLDIIHHLSAGFKAWWADYTYIAMDEMRQACGGAGYHMASGVALTWKNGAPHPTHEGVNVVMMQQSSRLLLKQMKVLE